MDLAASVQLIHQLAFRDHVFFLSPLEHSVGKVLEKARKGFFGGDL